MALSQKTPVIRTLPQGRTDGSSSGRKLSPSLAHPLALTTTGQPRSVSVPGRALLLKTLHGYDINHNFIL